MRYKKPRENHVNGNGKSTANVSVRNLNVLNLSSCNCMDQKPITQDKEDKNLPWRIHQHNRRSPHEQAAIQRIWWQHRKIRGLPHLKWGLQGCIQLWRDCQSTWSLERAFLMSEGISQHWWAEMKDDYLFDIFEGFGGDSEWDGVASSWFCALNKK